MNVNTSYNVQTISLSLFVIALSLSTSSQFLYALSPHFTRQEILDPPYDLISSNPEYSIVNETNKFQLIQANESTDIRSVGYFSDGRTLTFIIWLNKFHLRPWFDQSYGMLIDVKPKDRNGPEKFDYKLSIDWNSKYNNWTQTFSEISSSGESRVLNRTAPTNFHTNNKLAEGDYVMLSANLEAMSFPQKYRVLYYTQYGDRYSTYTDITNVITLPPPELTLTPFPNIVKIIRGEQQDIDLQINTTSGFTPTVHLYNTSSGDKNVNLTFDHNQVHVPSFGVERIPVKVETLKTSPTRSYPILLSANASFSSPSVFNASLIGTGILNTPLKSENTSAQTILMVDVKPEPTLPEKISSAWTQWGAPISGFQALIAAIAAGLSPFILSRIRRKVKHEQKKIDDWD